MKASESRNWGGSGSSECSTPRNNEETIEGARNDAVVISLRLSVSRNARVGASEREGETTEGFLQRRDRVGI